MVGMGCKNLNIYYFEPIFHEEAILSERAWFFAKQKERGQNRSEWAAGAKRASPNGKGVRENQEKGGNKFGRKKS